MSGSERRTLVSGRPLEGWRVASKGLGPLPRTRGSALALGCGRSGRAVLPPGERGRRVNRLEVTALVSRAAVSEVSAVTAAAVEAVAAVAAPAVEAFAEAFVAPA